jgi:hypothetical protein
MLREQDIRIDVGRATHGGDFLRMVHVPTEISRLHPGPLTGVDQYELRCRWLKEIESEVASRGLVQHILPDQPATPNHKHGTK